MLSPSSWCYRFLLLTHMQLITNLGQLLIWGVLVSVAGTAVW